MGNELCCSEPEMIRETPGSLTLTREVTFKSNPQLVVYGDWLSADTRAVVAILKHASVKFEFQLIDTLRNKQHDSTFTQISPGGHIPVFVQNGQKVIS